MRMNLRRKHLQVVASDWVTDETRRSKREVLRDHQLRDRSSEQMCPRAQALVMMNVM